MFKKLFSATTATENSGYVKNNHKRIKRSGEDDPFEFTDSSTEFFEGMSRKSAKKETTEFEITESVQSQFTEFSSIKKYMKDDFRNLDLTTIRTTDSEIYEYQDEVKETTLTESTEKINSDQFEESTAAISNIETSEDYNYDNLKAEYYQQIEEIQRRNGTFNYTDRGEPEDTAKDAIKKIVDLEMPKNCTKEELSQIGVKAFKCLAYDYKHGKKKTDVKRVFKRTWMVIKIWFFIYICIAIPCWCQRGINF